MKNELRTSTGTTQGERTMKKQARTPRGWDAILSRVEALGSYMEDPDNGLMVGCKRKPGTKSWTYTIQRMGVPTAEDWASVLKECEEADGVDPKDAPSIAAMSLAEFSKWKFSFSSLWKLDSLIQMLEAGEEPGDSITLAFGKPARNSEERIEK